MKRETSTTPAVLTRQGASVSARIDAALSPQPATRSIRTRLFGEIQVSTAVLFSLKFGMPGFESATTFVLVELRSGSRFRWLQSVDIPDLGFIVVDASEVYAGYPVPLVRRAIAFADIDPDEEVVALALCRIPSGDEPATANLLAPIGLGLRSRRGAQILLHDDSLSMSMPLVI